MTSILKVDTIQDADGNNIINESSNTITVGASGDTVALGSGALQSNLLTPIFSAYSNANQTGLTQGAYSKITLNAEYFDSDGAFDTSNYRFTVPSGKAGKYLILTRYGAKTSANSGHAIFGRIYKNGGAVTEGGFQHVLNNHYFSGNQDQIHSGFGFFDASVSDYFELYLQMNVQSSGTWVALGAWCSMTGYRLGT